jgi:glycosyltransferase involved in cell wall biosynthesis
MKQKIILKGPVLTRSGYGEQSRFALRALRSREDLFDIYIQPLVWGQTSWISDQSEERQFIDHTIEKTVGYIHQGGKFDMSLQITIPNEFEEMATVNIGYTAGIESTAVSAQWLEIINKVMNNVIVVSSFSTTAFKETSYQGELNGQPAELKLEKPIDYVNYAVKDYEDVPPLEIELEHDINFLSVAQWGPRKNMANTVKWFIEEFHDDEVGLIVKTNVAKNSVIDREHMFTRLREQIANKYPDRKCKLYLIHGDMTEAEMHSLYKTPKIKAMFSFPHGEGFGLPLFEAAYSGLPIVCTGWSGQLDFLVDEKGKEFFYNVAFDINHVPEEVVWENVLIKESMWANPRETSAKEQMRKCYNDILSGEKMAATEYASALKERFSKEKMYEKFVNLVHTQAPSQTVVNDMDEIEKLFSEAL